MSTWIASDSLKNAIDKVIKTPQEYWVTVVPDLQLTCRRKFASIPSILRIKQLLGLPPNYNVNYFLEFWVHRKDIVRLSPDPEVNDTVAELESNYISNDSSYNEWYVESKSGMYGSGTKEKPGFPWTRSGYTYDWGEIGEEMRLHYGVSEFVIRKDKEITVKDIVSGEQYIESFYR